MIYREINGVQIAINPNSANEIFFEERFIDEKDVDIENMSPPDICKLISGDRYLPMILTWELLDKCNFSCPFCYIVGHSNHKVVRFSSTKKHIEDLIKKGLIYCNLTGGEALLHKDFKEIYTFLKKSGVLIEIYSNGHLVNEKIIELFKEFPPYKIEISLYGVTQEQFDRVTGTKNKQYDLVLQNVLKLRDSGVNIKCKTPLNSVTEVDFEHIEQWCKQNNIEYYYSTSIYDAYDGKKLGNFQADFDKLIEFEAKKIIDIEATYPNTFNIFQTPRVKECYNCGVRNYGLHINANFELLPCSETKIKQCAYNILQLGIDECLKKNRLFVNEHLDKPISGCVGCEASSTCKMCPAIADPVQNNLGEILEFELPQGHCESERKKYNGLVAKLMER